MSVEMQFYFKTGKLFSRVMNPHPYIDASDLNMLGALIRERMMDMAERCRLLQELGWTLILRDEYIEAHTDSGSVQEAIEEAGICGITTGDASFFLAEGHENPTRSTTKDGEDALLDD